MSRTATVPDIGDRFVHDGHGYRVTAWLKATEARTSSTLAGPDRCAMEFCTREEAEYVGGYGVAGVLLRVADVRVSGRMPWSEEALNAARVNALALVGQHLR